MAENKTKIIIKVGTGDMQEVNVNGFKRNNLQVDRHLYNLDKETPRGFAECKTYLDVPYLIRTVFNFYELTESLKQKSIDPTRLSYIIIAGQNACMSENIEYYKERFKHLSGCELNIFFLNRTKNRTSKKPLYKYVYPLDYDEVLKLAELLEK